MKRDLKAFGDGSLLGEMEEVSSPGRQGRERGRNASLIRAAQDLSGLDGGFEVFLNGSPRKGATQNNSLQ